MSSNNIASARGLRCAAGLGVVAALCAIAVATGAPTQLHADENTTQDAETQSSWVDSMYETMAERAEAYAPRVVTLEDGTQIQRTPADLPTDGFAYFPGETISWNTYYLNADNRGCGACHLDLAQTLADGEYVHIDLKSNLGIQTTVQQCVFCHDFTANEPGRLGAAIHGIHERVDGMSCWNCHAETADGSLALFDVEKYNLFRGIVDVNADALAQTASFTFDQDARGAANDMFSFSYLQKAADYERYGNEHDGVPLDQELFDEWTITVTGEVAQDVTFSLADLVANAPSETLTVTEECGINPFGGMLIGTAEVTGVPLTYLFDQVELAEGATVIFGSEPGETYTFSTGLSLEYLEDAYLVYEMDGEPLSWKNGYPCAIWAPGHGAAKFVKQIGTITVSNLPAENFEAYRLGGNRPNVGFGFLQEGQVFEAGEPMTIQGFANDTTNAIVSVEFSLDGGQTWMAYETPDTTNACWVWWTLTWTPPAEGAYVIQLRATDDQGYTSPEPLKIMVVAHDGDVGAEEREGEL